MCFCRRRWIHLQKSGTWAGQNCSSFGNPTPTKSAEGLKFSSHCACPSPLFLAPPSQWFVTAYSPPPSPRPLLELAPPLIFPSMFPLAEQSHPLRRLQFGNLGALLGHFLPISSSYDFGWLAFLLWTSVSHL